MARTCPNCNTCTCTGSYLITMANNRVVCSKCVSLVLTQQEVTPVTPIPDVDPNRFNKQE